MSVTYKGFNLVQIVGIPDHIQTRATMYLILRLPLLFQLILSSPSFRVNVDPCT